MLDATVRGSDPRAVLVGRDAYLAAGGRIERELFDDDASESWIDVALLEDLAHKAMEEAAEMTALEYGLAWVRPTLGNYVSHDFVEGLSRLPCEPAPITEMEAQELGELEADYDRLAAILEDEDSDEDEVAKAEEELVAINRAMRDLTDRPPVLAEELKAEAGILLRNAFADCGISTYCGLAAIWLAERDDSHYWEADFYMPRTARARHWLGQVSGRFIDLFGELRLVGRFSNGEAIFERDYPCN